MAALTRPFEEVKLSSDVQEKHFLNTSDGVKAEIPPYLAMKVLETHIAKSKEEYEL